MAIGANAKAREAGTIEPSDNYRTEVKFVLRKTDFNLGIATAG